MTIIKLIKCKVKEGQHESFSNGQLAWEALRHCEGFEGQCGGWTQSREALVLGKWCSSGDVAQFMASVHDSIFLKSNQEATYSECDIHYLEHCHSIVPLVTKNNAPGSGVISVSRHDNISDVDRFMHDQTNIWHPVLIRAEGMLGCFISVSTLHSDCFLVVTHWQSFSDYEHFKESTLLREEQQNEPQRYLCDLSECLVNEEVSWRVFPENTKEKSMY
ncbi:DUF4937 domain-containing protein [Veronia pacifica]|uniref:DUF4937 domain-containing protein n=1 Tax=Veronia pacifica TaxID=1080227 RepID=A0A1C3EL61_9GAMM|nr:DUF4937 domain-containing protein [Veronia pacifica]ODA33960.1 hypothetical protein A8L45_07880 [Veronia pacifica]